MAASPFEHTPPRRHSSEGPIIVVPGSLRDAVLRAMEGGLAYADAAVLGDFLDRIETGYDAQVPYHNVEHVKTVVHATARLWRTCGLCDVVRRLVPAEADIEELALFVAAAVHDHEHQGLTNDFLIRSLHPFSIIHNDVSPNESHHAASAFEVMFDGLNFLRCTPAQARLFRSRVIELVLATDIAHHFAVVQAMRSRDFSDMTVADVPLLMKAALKAADLGHTFMPWSDHCAWSKVLQKEMFAEGDLHRLSLGSEPPTIMDRRACAAGHTFESAQAGFFQYIVIPLLESLAVPLPASRSVLADARANARRWESSPLAKTRSGTLDLTT